MPEKIDPKILYVEIKARIREFYPYFIGFYIFSLVFAGFSATWSSFFYWPAVHIVAVVFTLLFVLTHKFTLIFDRGLEVVGRTKTFLYQSIARFKQYIILIRPRLLRPSPLARLKIFLITTIMTAVIVKGIGILNFIVLFYALVSFVFVLSSRITAMVGLLLLALCPLLLISNKEPWAENIAVYAYYFLAITVLTQIRELRRGKDPVDNSGLNDCYGRKKVV